MLPALTLPILEPNPIADRVACDPIAERLHDARTVTLRDDERIDFLVASESAPHAFIRWIDAGCENPDQYFAGAGIRHWFFAQDQDIQGSALAFAPEGAHPPNRPPYCGRFRNVPTPQLSAAPVG